MSNEALITSTLGVEVNDIDIYPSLDIIQTLHQRERIMGIFNKGKKRCGKTLSDVESKTYFISGEVIEELEKQKKLPDDPTRLTRIERATEHQEIAGIQVQHERQGNQIILTFTDEAEARVVEGHVGKVIDEVKRAAYVYAPEYHKTDK